MEKILIVVPAHNEQDTISLVIKDLFSCGYLDVLVVDDASQDKTAFIAKEAGARVMSLPYNLGAWKATQAGLRFAKAHMYDSVVTFDADQQHLASEIDALIKYQQTDDLDIVIGSCTSRGSLARHVAWGFFRFLSGVKVQDLTSGLRLYNKRAVDVLSCKEASLLEYQDVGVLLLLRTFKLTKGEAVVKMQERTNGISRIFYSWGAVTYYMFYTIMLCLSKIAKKAHLLPE